MLDRFRGVSPLTERIARRMGVEGVQEVRRRDLDPVLDELDLQVRPELDGTDVQLGEAE